jgi:hypothetical protein
MGDAPAVWFLPEHITHLYYSPVYATLSRAQKLVYNRLHACYHCEVCSFLETELPRYYLEAASARHIPSRLMGEARALADSEKRHSAAFRALARELSPALYSGKEYVFAGPFLRASLLFRTMLNWPALRPMLLWIALIQEERGVFFSEEILRQAERLDSRMVDWQQEHLADETGHLSLGEALLPLYWDGSPLWVRHLSGGLLRLVLREFLSAPKRSGVHVIEYLVKECPELRPRKDELIKAMRGLDHNPEFHHSLYSRSIVPKTFRLFDRYPEFRDLGRSVRGYSPEVQQ